MSTTTLKSPAVAAVAASRDWKIDNECTTTDLVVIQCTTSEVVPSKFYYGQKLTRIAPSAIQQMIPAGIVSTVAVPDETKDADGNPQDFTFILANAKTLFPVSLVTFEAGTTSFDDITVTDTDVDNMASALKFYANIVCFPGSTLATDFTKALQSADPEKEVDTFFKGQDDYKNVTLDMYHAVTTYYTYLPYGWAGEGKNKTYWIYKGDQADTLPVGKLEITNKWSVPLDVTPTDDFKATLIVKGMDDTALNFKEGLLYDRAGGDASISLLGSFILKSKLTENISDGELVTYFIGTINEVGTFALDYEYKSEDNEDGGFYQITHPGNWKEGLDLFVYITSVGMGIAFVAGLIKTVLWLKKRRLPNESEEALKQRFKDLENVLKSRTDYMLGKIREGAKFPTPEQLQKSQDAARSEQLRDRVISSKEKLSQVIQRQEQILEPLVQFGNSTRLQKVQAELLKLREFEGFSLKDYLDNMWEAAASMRANQENLTSRKAELNHRLLDAERTRMDEALAANQETIGRFEGERREMDAINDEFEFERLEG